MIKEALTIGYEAGLEDAWECVRKMERMLWDDTLRSIFGEEDYYTLVTKHDAEYCMQKIKEYEERQKQTEEKTDKSCESCRFVDLQEYEFPCSACSASHTFRWEARKGAEE